MTRDNKNNGSIAFYTESDMKKAIEQARSEGSIEVVKGLVCGVMFFVALWLAFVLFA